MIIAEQILTNPDVKINADLHLKTAEQLINAISAGLASIGSSETDSKVLVEKLKQNIYAFSAAKSFTQMQYYRDAMVGDDGKILGVGSFIKKIADTGEIFNKKHLESEYENAYYSAVMADKWDRFPDDELLQYTTVGDSRVRPSHAVLDKYTAPKSDGFWKSNYPPNGWGCRCSVVPGKESHQNNLSRQEAGRQLKDENKDTPFYNNVGLSRVIFKDNHPYFINANGKEVNLSWQQYGLPDLNKIRSEELPTYREKTRDEYHEWWKKQPKKDGTDDIIVKSILGDVTLPSGTGKGKTSINYFKDHILKQDVERRFEFATETKSILERPDEVWLNPKDKNVKTFLKFFEQGIIKIIVDENNDAVTIYKLDNDHEGALGKARKGILMHRQ